MEEQLQRLGVVAIAAGLGALVGVEREFADKPAGLRTHMFVGAASAMLMLLGDSVLDRFQQEDLGSVRADPIRIIQAIVVGISFLGAGTIIHHPDNRVEGLRCGRLCCIDDARGRYALRCRTSEGHL